MGVSTPQQFLSGSSGGNAAQLLLRHNMDINCLRPWIGRDERSYLALNDGIGDDGKMKQKVITTNAPSTLMYDEWKLFDQAVVRAARPGLRFYGDIRGTPGLQYDIADGMATTILLYQSMTDAGKATISMDALRTTERDRTTFDLHGMPIPIISEDFSFSLREIATSRKSGNPLDTTMIEQATRKVSEAVEELALGTSDTYTYGGYTLYGVTNYPDRLTKVITAPNAGGYTPETSVNEILDMIQQLSDVNIRGPFGVYFSKSFTKYLNKDYSAAYPAGTLLTRLRQIEDISYWRTLDYLTGFQILVVQLSPWTIQAVQGMPFTTIQWEANGGFELKFKVLTIALPRIRSNSNGNTGIVHGVSA